MLDAEQLAKHYEIQSFKVTLREVSLSVLVSAQHKRFNPMIAV
jgi:hypothetical protein